MTFVDRFVTKENHPIVVVLFVLFGFVCLFVCSTCFGHSDFFVDDRPPSFRPGRFELEKRHWKVGLTTIQQVKSQAGTYIQKVIYQYHMIRTDISYVWLLFADFRFGC